MVRQTRRTFLQGSGALLGGLVATNTVAAGGSDGPQRFLVDTRDVDPASLPGDLDVLHDLSEIDLLVARGDPDEMPSAATTAVDPAVQNHEAKAGPTMPQDGQQGPAFDTGLTIGDLQWDKRAQDLANVDEQPGSKGNKYAHDTTTGEGARIAVVDSGVADYHPDLAHAVNPRLSANVTTDPYDFRPNGAGDHGTHVAGTIAAAGQGALGTAPDAEIVALRVFSGVEGAFGDVVAAIVYAANVGCDAANLSLGIPADAFDDAPEEVIESYIEYYQRAADFARANDMVVVNSTGNEGLNMDPADVVSLPTEVENVFGVSATGPVGFLWDGDEHDHQGLAPGKLDALPDTPAPYTNYGRQATDISAAGGNYDVEAARAGIPGWYYDLVLSTTVTRDEDTGRVSVGYGWKAGTSMAAPQVSGAVALVRSLSPDASAAEVEAILADTAATADEGELYHGAGHLDVRAAVKAAAKGAKGKGKRK